MLLGHARDRSDGRRPLVVTRVQTSSRVLSAKGLWNEQSCHRIIPNEYTSQLKLYDLPMATTSSGAIHLGVPTTPFNLCPGGISKARPKSNSFSSPVASQNPVFWSFKSWKTMLFLWRYSIPLAMPRAAVFKRYPSLLWLLARHRSLQSPVKCIT